MQDWDTKWTKEMLNLIPRLDYIIEVGEILVLSYFLAHGQNESIRLNALDMYNT